MAENIVSQSSGYAQNYGENGWYGGLSAFGLHPEQMYLLKMNEPGTLPITLKYLDSLSAKGKPTYPKPIIEIFKLFLIIYYLEMLI